MGRNAASTVENNFIKGIVTEFSGLNFPENACEDALNCFFTEQGEVRRRYGIDFESSFSYVNKDINNDEVTHSFHWQNVNGDSTTSFIVVQAGANLYFFRFNGGDSVSSQYDVSLDINLVQYATSGSPSIGLKYCQFVSGSGLLYVAHPYLKPLYIKYDDVNNQMDVNVLDIKIRDFKVLTDGYQVDESPSKSSMSAEYEYNIRNQGWTNRYLDMWWNVNSTAPSKAELWWYFRLAAGSTDKQVDAAQEGLEFRNGKRSRFPTAGNALAPRGYFILDAFNQDRGSKIGRAGIPSITSGYQRPSCVAFMNSRIFYGGIDAYHYNGVIYFSNIIRDVDQEIRFYQNGDPTSELNYELLANDGGNIVIQDAGRIIYMVQVKSALMVFCQNGIWAVKGSEGTGFSPLDYTVDKISDIGVISQNNITLIDGIPIWWNNEGIYSITEQGVASVSIGTIQTLYDRISSTAKLYAKAAYNRLSREVYWLYSTDEDNPRNYNKALIFRSTTGSFYIYEFLGTPILKDIVSLQGLSTVVSEENVLDNSGVVVTDILDADVTVELETIIHVNSQFKILTKVGTTITFSEVIDTTYKDWVSFDSTGISYSSYFITGFRVHAGANKKWQANYVTVYSRVEDNASAYMRAIWDFVNSGDTGQITNSQQIYNPQLNRDFSFRRLKVRGTGMALQLKFTSDGNKPFGVIGWASSETANARV